MDNSDTERFVFQAYLLLNDLSNLSVVEWLALSHQAVLLFRILLQMFIDYLDKCRTYDVNLLCSFFSLILYLLKMNFFTLGVKIRRLFSLSSD